MSKELEQKLIDFENDKILGFKTEDGQVWLGIRKSCIDIGLTENQADRQVKNAKTDLALMDSVKNLSVKFDDQIRDIIVINEDAVALFFAKISLTPSMRDKNPIAVTKLVSYQKKAQKALHNAFMATEEQKQEFYSEMGLQGEIVELKTEVQTLNNKLNTLIDSSTINSRQAQKLLTSAKERVSTILGGAHSSKYKKDSRMYFINLWQDFCKQFETSTYKDLNPVHFSDGFTFISHWSMT